MHTRPSTAPACPPERRGGGRSRGSHARGPERTPGRAGPARSGPQPDVATRTGPDAAGAGTGGERARAGRSRTARGQTVRGHAGAPTAPGAPWHAAKVWRGPRTVRAKVVSLLMVPIISLMALWGLAAVSTAQNMWSLLQLRTVNTDVREPIETAISALQQERAAAMRLLSVSNEGTDIGGAQTGYQADFAATDNAQAQIRTGAQQAAAALAYLGSDTQQRINTLMSSLGSLGTLRHQVADGTIGVAAAYSDYCAAIDDAFAVEGSLAALQDDTAGSEAQPALQLAQAGEMLARQDSVLAAAYSAGRISQADYQEFVGAAYSQNLLQLDASRALRPADQAAYQRVVGSAQYLQLRREQTTVLATGTGTAAALGFTLADWTRPESVTLSGFDSVATAAGETAVAGIDPYSYLLTTPQGLAVLVGLAAVLLSLLVSVQIGRGLVLELVGLRDTALDLARRRLPRAIARLRAGLSVDVDVEAPPAVAVEDEIGQVAEALAAAARAAIQAAVERAEVVSAVAGVFLNLARRSQLLVHRQLALLDTMERRNEDPDELEDLFRLDHLATRMRRHAEGLIILSGAAPGRGWRKPVPLMDVLRAAVAEVEDYARVDVRRLELVHLAGAAVADLTHLLAELVENATVFSPPHTRVQVRGEPVGSGFAIDIEDRGLGMGEHAITEANQRIAGADRTDLFDSDRLGLFVVSRLAQRHHIQVTLGRSAYGGTTAVVLLPKELLENTAAGSYSQAEVEHRQTGDEEAEETRGELTGQSEFADASIGASAAAGVGVRVGISGVGSVSNGVFEGEASGEAGENTTAPEPILIAVPGQFDGGTLTGLDEADSAPWDTLHPRAPHPDQAQPAETGSTPPDSASWDALRASSLHSDSFHSPESSPAPPDPAPGDTSRRRVSLADRVPQTEDGSRPPDSEYWDTTLSGQISSVQSDSLPPYSDPPRSARGRSGVPDQPFRRPAAKPSGPLPPSGKSTAQVSEELPRRVRQASLAPQLRVDPHGPGDPADRVPPHPGAPVTPERARATMAAFQAGWIRGRSELVGECAARPGPAAAGRSVFDTGEFATGEFAGSQAADPSAAGTPDG
jgi:signal transduction histidine kinase